MMIIKSSLLQSSYHRRTLLDSPASQTLASIIQNLLQQWNLADHSNAAQTSQDFALAITLDSGEKLVIDKQKEWILFCSEHCTDSDQAKAITVNVELVARESIFDRQKSEPGQSLTDVSLKHTVAQLQADVQKLSVSIRDQQNPAHQPAVTQSAAPKPGFLSIEPQAIKSASTKPGPRESLHSPAKIQAQQQPSSSLQQSSTTARDPSTFSQPQMTMEELAERSRKQGESLNQFFGAMQARSAGRAYTSQQRQQESEQEHLQEATAVSAPESSLQANALDSSYSASSLPVQNDTVNHVQEQDEKNDENHGETRPLDEQVTNVNGYLDGLWQERLKQMGHGEGSYGAMRRQRLKAEADAEKSSSQNTLTDLELRKASSSSLIKEADPFHGRSTLNALDEVNEEQSAGQSVSQVFPLRAALPEESEVQEVSTGRVSSFTQMSDDLRFHSGRGQAVPAEPKAKNSSLLLNKLFKRNRGISDTARPASLQNSGHATPDGAMTPRSFNSAVFRRRPLSIRSLSDSLTGAARERARSAARQADITQSETPSLTTSSSRPTMSQRRHVSTRSLSELNALLLSSVRRDRDGMPMKSKKANQSVELLADKNVDETPRENRLPLSKEFQTAGAGATAATQIARPSLLRSTHSTPVSATAVNLSSVGGITLHMSSIGSSKFSMDGHRLSLDAGADATLAHRSDKNLFDLVLPRELRISCFRALIQLHHDEAAKAQQQLQLQPDQSRDIARHDGNVRAMSELIRLSSVSRSWQSLIFDGQLWQTLDVSRASGISNECLLRLTSKAGPFVKHLKLCNMQNLSSDVFMAMTTTPPRATQRSLTAMTPAGRDPLTMMPTSNRARASTARLPATGMAISNVAMHSLTHLNVQGCRNLSTEALHHALVRLPQLLHLNASNLPSLNNNSCLLLGATLPHLRSLNVSRCLNVSGDGLIAFIDAAQGCLYDRALFSQKRTNELPDVSNVVLDLQDLRAAGLRGADDLLMERIGGALRNLRTLDLSYATDMTDNAVAALTRHPGFNVIGSDNVTQSGYQQNKVRHDSPSGPFVVLSQRQAGGNVLLDGPHFRRLMPCLTHLTLSSCRGLTDRSASHLAFAVPALKTIELANIGNSLRDEGLVRLLETTPLIERIDVEGATELTDAFLHAITPPAEYITSLTDEWQVSRSTFSTGRSGRRSFRRSRQQHELNESSAGVNGMSSPSSQKSGNEKWNRELPTGACLTHLVVSHLARLSGESLLTLVRRSPKLIHLEADDTRANDALLSEFVSLQRQRRQYGAYISLVDCRLLSKNANSQVYQSGQARPRKGKTDPEFSIFHYEGNVNEKQRSQVPATLSQSRLSASAFAASVPSHPQTNAGQRTQNDETLINTPGPSNGSRPAPNECDASLVVVKTFWAWQGVDVRQRTRRRAEAKRLATLNGGSGAGKARLTDRNGRLRRSDSLAAALTFLGAGSAFSGLGLGNGGGSGGSERDFSDDEEAQGRWTRLASGLLGPGDEGEDARVCTIM